VPASYKIDKDRRLVLTSGADVLTTEDILMHMEQLTSDPDFSPDFFQLVDFTQVTSVQITSKEIRHLAERNIFSPNARRAVVVSNELQFGLTRMFEIHRNLNGEKGIHVFRTLAEAIDWLAVDHGSQ
jgi:hypothetical protein